MKRIELSPYGVRVVKEAFSDYSLTELKYMCVDPDGENYRVGFSVVAGNRLKLNDGTDTVIVSADKMADILFQLLD